MDYFKKLLGLLNIERQEDRQSWIALTEKSTVAERRADGLTWFPIAIRDTEISRGDYLTIELERTSHKDLPHQLRFGMPAVLFSNHDAKNDRVEGIIVQLAGNQLKLTINTDELPEWTSNGKLGIDLLFDDNSYDEMAAALKSATALVEKEKGGQLARILIGEKKPGFQELLPEKVFPKLNQLQQVAVRKILSANELAIVHGPPGTGKTTTLVQGIRALIERDHQQILVVAPSNTAVDLLCEKLSDEGLNVIRIGNPVRVSERLLSLTLDSRMATHPRMKQVKNLKKQANDLRNMAHKYKRNFGQAEREQRRALFEAARNITKEISDTEQFVMDDLLRKAQVITATLVGANHYTLKKLRFHTVVMDEAGQSLEPASWIAIVKAEKLILAGDHCQLPPTVKSNQAAKNGLGITLLEKSVALQPEAVVLLEEQYRMHERIMGYSSKVFYEEKLKAHPSVAGHLLFPGDLPLEFIDTAGCGFEEKTDGTSTTNPEEAAFLYKHLNALVTTLNGIYLPEDFPTIAIISPYKQQINLLKEYLDHNALLKVHGKKIAVNTIDSFQGQERDIVYISMTRSNPGGQIGFLSDIRRMNVAMTRARKKLVVIGDSATLSRLPFYAGFIDYAMGANAYRSAWEFGEGE